MVVRVCANGTEYSQTDGYALVLVFVGVCACWYLVL